MLKLPTLFASLFLTDSLIKNLSLHPSYISTLFGLSVEIGLYEQDLATVVGPGSGQNFLEQEKMSLA